MIPVLIYPDVREAVAWLTDAFGFAERVQIGENHRSQLSFGDGAVIVGDVRHDRRPPRPGEVTHSVVVRVEAADAHCARARARGATILMEPTDFEYGERQYTAEDPRATNGRSPRRCVTSPPRSGAGSWWRPTPDASHAGRRRYAAVATACFEVAARGRSSESAPAPSTKTTDAHRQASRPCHW